jgi:hypothetical protein
MSTSTSIELSGALVQAMEAAMVPDLTPVLSPTELAASHHAA